ncbi:hypothetical protein NW755_013346 [Fusarium falciforme]|uniref:Uncharacterized protein n=1 Tax=Fusarium falciforme TaxID=195108 RepID=A0A9W8QTH1_9HYPO|nr:hypothetical protein NW755_013346 [Fusarium falciforme]
MSEKVGCETIKIFNKLQENLPTSELVDTSWRDYGEVIPVDNINEAYKLADEFSSEHVQILTQDPREALEKMSNYGALFLGEKTCVPYGDKARPQPRKEETGSDWMTLGNYTGGPWVGKFLKTQPYQEIGDEKASGEMGRLCGRCSRAENFEGHARSGDLRAQKYLGDEYGWINEVRERL